VRNLPAPLEQADRLPTLPAAPRPRFPLRTPPEVTFIRIDFTTQFVAGKFRCDGPSQSHVETKGRVRLHPNDLGSSPLPSYPQRNVPRVCFGSWLKDNFFFRAWTVSLRIFMSLATSSPTLIFNLSGINHWIDWIQALNVSCRYHAHILLATGMRPVFGMEPLERYNKAHLRDLTA
jgi:hypothetical protein